ncbi:hypothetical protein QYE76_037519 [Lolium multiflorum]|uniref:Uncharacterized protein n=1 Tax=Lolium multiflorum TaxID=4521 RepID=A0AAD8QFG5_LOLMU|nr:hypothetical protein QYE76_037519 [Lolium multiflorum]
MTRGHTLDADTIAGIVLGGVVVVGVICFGVWLCRRCLRLHRQRRATRRHIRHNGDLEKGQSSAPPDDLQPVLRRDVGLQRDGESPDITEVEHEQRGGRMPPAALDHGRDVVTSPAGLQLDE